MSKTTPTPEERAKSIRLCTTTLDGARVLRLPDLVLSDIIIAIREAEHAARLEGAAAALVWVEQCFQDAQNHRKPTSYAQQNADLYAFDVVARLEERRSASR